MATPLETQTVNGKLYGRMYWLARHHWKIPYKISMAIGFEGLSCGLLWIFPKVFDGDMESERVSRLTGFSAERLSMQASRRGNTILRSCLHREQITDGGHTTLAWSPQCNSRNHIWPLRMPRATTLATAHNRSKCRELRPAKFKYDPYHCNKNAS
ncbi:uncharacterized protein LOC144058445 isoform X1 [Vanacampus margaritifer]